MTKPYSYDLRQKVMQANQQLRRKRTEYETATF